MIYHSGGGESFLRRITRLNVLFIVCNGALLVAEITSPCKYFCLTDNFTFLIVFGYWHGVSLLATILLNLLGSRMLNYYSSRMVNSMWLLRDGKTVEM